jgi:hypothetical protein
MSRFGTFEGNRDGEFSDQLSPNSIYSNKKTNIVDRDLKTVKVFGPKCTNILSNNVDSLRSAGLSFIKNHLIFNEIHTSMTARKTMFMKSSTL